MLCLEEIIMKSQKLIRLPCILTILYILITNETNADTSCNRNCPEFDDGYLSYKPGNVYEYNFDSIMTVGLNSDSANWDNTTLKIAGSAKLFAEGNCGYTFQLDVIKVKATKENVEKKILQNIQKPVYFTMVSGKVEAELCIDQSDNVYALNIKRAIISMLQSKPDAVKEIDVFGECPTHTTVTKTGNVEIVNKFRNLNLCRYNKIGNGRVLTDHVQSQSRLNTHSVITADYFKESKIERAIVSSVQLIEEYKYITASKSDVSVSARIVTNLKLKNTSSSSVSTPATGLRSAFIMFQQPESYTSKNIAVLQKGLTELVQLLDGYVKKKSATSFMELIRLMRNSDTDTLLELSAFLLPNKVLARKVYLDALFRTATSESARAIIKQFHKMNKKEKIVGVLSLNLVKSVDRDTLNHASTLLNQNSIKEVYPAVSSLVSKYCERNECNNKDIEIILKKFTEILKQCIANTKKDEERILFVLKGIGNTHHIAKGVTSSLTECVSRGRSNRIRVAALQAFSAANCDSNLQKKALELLADRNEDSELRIEAFLAAINCPSAELANKISEIVNSETVNQVGGFITSTLTVIRDSTDKSKELLRRYLGNLRITKNFPKNFKRYSYNNEVSYKIKALDLSARADYKLIYSQNGFLPRSVCLNIKAERFGIILNILDARIRQQNFENILEYFLGPKGLINRDLGGFSGKAKVENYPHSPRSIASDTSKVAKKYKSYETRNVYDLNLDLSLRLFNSELLFFSLGDDIPSTFDEIARELNIALENVKKNISNYNKEYTSHNLLMDTEMTYPTGIGIPLELTLNGFLTNKINFGVSVDVERLMQYSWYHSNYNFTFVPSIDANVFLKVGFNAHSLSSGLRSSISMHTATGSLVKLAITHEGSGFDMNIELPYEKLELIDIKMQTQFYISEQNKPLKLVPLKGSRSEANDPHFEKCYKQFDSLGILPCTVKSFGDFKLEHSLWKTFGFTTYIMTERHLKLKGYKNNQEGVQLWKLDYSTPGSKESHDTSLTLELGSKPRVCGRITLDNSRYHFAVETGFNNDNKEIVFYALYEQDKAVKRSKLGFVKNGNEYRPVIEIQDINGVISNEINGYRVSGRVIIEKAGDQSRLRFENFEISNKFNNRLVVNGNAELEPASLSTELQISTFESSYFIISNTKASGGEYLAGFFLNEEKAPDNVYGANIDIRVGSQLTYIEFLSKFGHWEASATRSIQYVKQEKNNPKFSSQFTSSFKVKHKQIIVGCLEIDSLSEGKNKFEVKVNATFGEKIAAVSVKYTVNRNSSNDYQLSVNTKFNQILLDIESKYYKIGNHFVLDNILTTSWGLILIFKGEMGQRYTPQDIFMDVQGIARFSDKYKPSKFRLRVIRKEEKTDLELKVSYDNVEVIKVLTETQNVKDKATIGRVSIVFRNILNANCDLKFAQNGNGEITATLENLKKNSKHKVEIIFKLHLQKPTYDFEATIVMDDNKKIYARSENTADELYFNTKNIIDVAQKRTLLDANVFVKGNWQINGEVQGQLSATSPEGRSVSGFFRRRKNTNIKTGITQGIMELQFADQLPNNKSKRSFILSGKLENVNVKTAEFSIILRAVYTNFETQILESNLHLKKSSRGQNKIIDFGNSFKGSMVKFPFHIKFIFEKYSSQSALFNIESKYHNVISVNINGNYDINTRGTELKYEIHSDIYLPENLFKTIEVNSSGQIKQRQAKYGSYIFELFVGEKVGSQQFIAFRANVKSSENISAFSINLGTQRMETPLQVEGSYFHEQRNLFSKHIEIRPLKYELSFIYAKNFVNLSNILNFSGKRMLSCNFTLTSSFEIAKIIEVEVKTTWLDTDTYNLNAVGKRNKKAYSLDYTLYRGNHKKGVKLFICLPNDKPINVISLFEVIGNCKAGMTFELLNVIDVDFKLYSEAFYNAVDRFYIIAQWNSEKLKLNNFDLDFRTQNKSLFLRLKSAQGEIFAGYADCAFNKENGKHILEGQGQILFNGRPQITNFRLTKQLYEMTTDKESGFSYTLNGNLGPINSSTTFKITTKDFNIKLSVCKDKRQCINMQIIASNDLTENYTSTHSFLILLDLLELGFPFRFELQSKNVNKGLIFQFIVDSYIISSNNLKYNILANIQPENLEVQLKFPTREIFLEAYQKFPANNHIFGQYENYVAFFTDKKNNPLKVTRLVAQADLKNVEHIAVNAEGLLKFEHPQIRPLTISGKLNADREKHIINTEVVFDIFELPEQQVIATSHMQHVMLINGFNLTCSQIARSTGLDFEYALHNHASLNIEQPEFSYGSKLSLDALNMESSAFLFVNKEHAELLVDFLNKEILNFIADFNIQKNISELNAKLQILKKKTIEINAELHPVIAKLTVIGEGLVNAQSEIKLGNGFKFQVESAGKELMRGYVGLDIANFLNTSFNSDEDNLNKFTKVLENEMFEASGVTHEIRTQLKELRKATSRHMNLTIDSLQHFSLISTSYQNSLREITREFKEDPAFRQLCQNLLNIYSKCCGLAGEFIKLWSGNYEKFYKSLFSIYEKLQVFLKKACLPVWKEFVANTNRIWNEISLKIAHVYYELNQSLLDMLKMYESTLKIYEKATTETLKSFNKIIQDTFTALVSVFKKNFNEWIEYWIKLPTFNEKNHILQSLQLNKKLLELLNNVLDQFRILILNAETTKLLQKVHDYVSAKLRQQTLENEYRIIELINLSLKSVRSILASLGMKAISFINLSSKNLLVTAPKLSDFFTQLSSLLPLRFSVVNFLINEDWENWLTKSHKILWTIFHEFDLKGHVVDGQHVFTFDGKYIYFTGNCKYILAQDFVGNNFSVIAHFNNGKIRTLFITDRDGLFMEINERGALKLNGNTVEFPQHYNGMHAWRSYYTVHMVSEYGVHLMCTTDLKVCHIDVNGFYSAKVRGLLGNGNAEPYDDLTQIDGSIADDATTFISGYGLGKCNPAAIKIHAGNASFHRSDICNELFAYESPLSVGYFSIDFRSYHNACDQSVLTAVGNEKEVAACLIARAYVSALRLKNIFVLLPKRCFKCPGTFGQRELGDDFTLKLPTNKADIVFVVDVEITPIVMKNLVAPVVTEVRQTLKSRGFTDIQIGVIAYSDYQLYPAILTSDNGKLNYQGNLAETKLTGPKPFYESSVSPIIKEKKILNIFKILKSFLRSILPQSDELAYRMALNYPFRAGAAKSIVAVRGNSFEYNNMLRFVRVQWTIFNQFESALLHIIAPVKNMTLEGVPTENLIGFNSRLVATLDGRDSKKRTKLQFHNDVGTKFVLSNGGWVFATQNFEHIKPQEQKKTLDQITSSIADTLYKTEVVTDCHCSSIDGLYAQHKCIIKSSNFAPNKKFNA